MKYYAVFWFASQALSQKSVLFVIDPVREINYEIIFVLGNGNQTFLFAS